MLKKNTNSKIAEDSESSCPESGTTDDCEDVRVTESEMFESLLYPQVNSPCPDIARNAEMSRGDIPQEKGADERYHEESDGPNKSRKVSVEM